MVRQHYQLNEHEFEQTPGDSEGQGSLSWDHKELDMTQRLNSNNNLEYIRLLQLDKKKTSTEKLSKEPNRHSPKKYANSQ